ncbi:hypothetical protein C5167_000255 [Papaver somniferum]|uniref:Uncharacterized protein n=1 Tax=Papaver somniferum TaxID=3469 RepID=A0A4Y7KVI9_PAPSO|nr:hypothetical protein C5167_000255 [Papaver somniferum]
MGSTDDSTGSTNESVIALPSNIHHLINTKLEQDNYLLWKSQFFPLLEGYGLEGYVDGSLSAPSKFLADKVTPNPSFVAWRRQDKIITSWLRSSLSPGVGLLVIGLQTARDIWVSLESRFASASRARINQLQRQLQTIRKGGLSMNEFFLQAKKISDDLAACGEPFSDAAVQQMLLAGLDSSYDPIVATLTTISDLSMADF